MKTEQEAIRIREVYLRLGSIQGAAHECGCCWRTVKAVLGRDYGTDDGITHRHRQPNAWHDRIEELIRANLPNECACRKLFLTAKRITDIIRAEGASLCARHVQRIAAKIREKIKTSHGDGAKLMTEGVPGCWQVDFGEMECMILGRRKRLHLLVVSGRYSNSAVFTVCESEQADALFDGLARCFDQLGGVPAVLRFDNMAPVACWTRCRERQMTDSFSRFACHYGFKPELCNPASGWEKGNVECKVKYVRQNFFVPVPDYESIEALNAALADWSKTDMQRPHYQKGAQICDLFEAERQSFLPLPKKPFEFWRQYDARTDRHGCIQFENNRYFAAKDAARRHVIIQVSTRRLRIFDTQMHLLAEHDRKYGRGNVIQPVHCLAEMLAEKPAAIPYCLPSMPDASRVMDDVKRLRIADRVGAVLQFLLENKNMPVSQASVADVDMSVYDKLAFGHYEQRKRDIEPVHKVEIGHSNSGHAAGTG